jgi:hypothetical protein
MLSRIENAVIVDRGNYSFVAYNVKRYLHHLTKLNQKGTQQCLEIFTIPMI